LGVEYSVSPEIWAEASPLNWVDGNEPPFLVIHGAADRNIDPRQSIDFAEAFDAFGVGKQLLIIPDSDHTGIIWSETALEAVEKFFTALISP
jgi:dipeptidyl aminopeptidase/acylaminoacyl peptidase